MHSYAALDQLASQHRADLLAEADARRLHRSARRLRRARPADTTRSRAAPASSELRLAACA